jgi:hypothetical protein
MSRSRPRRWKETFKVAMGIRIVDLKEANR